MLYDLRDGYRTGRHWKRHSILPVSVRLKLAIVENISR